MPWVQGGGRGSRKRGAGLAATKELRHQGEAAAQRVVIPHAEGCSAWPSPTRSLPLPGKGVGLLAPGVALQLPSPPTAGPHHVEGAKGAAARQHERSAAKGVARLTQESHLLLQWHFWGGHRQQRGRGGRADGKDAKQMSLEQRGMRELGRRQHNVLGRTAHVQSPLPSLTWRCGDVPQVVLHLLDVLLDQVGHHGQLLVQLAAPRREIFCCGNKCSCRPCRHQQMQVQHPDLTTPSGGLTHAVRGPVHPAWQGRASPCTAPPPLNMPYLFVMLPRLRNRSARTANATSATSPLACTRRR